MRTGSSILVALAGVLLAFEPLTANPYPDGKPPKKETKPQSNPKPPQQPADQKQTPTQNPNPPQQNPQPPTDQPTAGPQPPNTSRGQLGLTAPSGAQARSVQQMYDEVKDLMWSYYSPFRYLRTSDQFSLKDPRIVLLLTALQNDRQRAKIINWFSSYTTGEFTDYVLERLPGYWAKQAEAYDEMEWMYRDAASVGGVHQEGFRRLAENFSQEAKEMRGWALDPNSNDLYRRWKSSSASRELNTRKAGAEVSPGVRELLKDLFKDLGPDSMKKRFSEAFPLVR